MGEIAWMLAKILAQAAVNAIHKAFKPKDVPGLPYADVEYQRAQIRKATGR